jgi:phosphoglycolate phosphatase-like HAD superfamily hydrolase
MESFAFPNLDRDWAGYRHHTDRAIFSEAWERSGRSRPSEANHRIFAERLVRQFEVERAALPVREIPGAAAFVTALREAGWRVVFATGGVRETARTKLQMAEIAFTEDLLITGSEHMTREELVVAALEAANGHDLPVGNIVLVGDGLWDMRAAENLGLRFLGIGTDAKAKLLTDRGAG